eukprot:Amastigsp_a2251_82.p1 type:complete len:368 gc:universal Amastigsp_a2251_82:1176-73(-)
MADDLPILAADIGSLNLRVGGTTGYVTGYAAVFSRSPQQPSEDSEHHVCEYAPYVDVQTTFAIERGVVTNWPVLEKLWMFPLYGACLGAELPLLIAENAFYPEAADMRAKCTEMLFTDPFDETPAVRFGDRSLFSMLAAGQTTGVVLDCGHGTTNIAPVVDGRVVTDACVRLNLAGIDITNFVMDAQRERGIVCGLEDVELAKKRHGYVAADYESEIRTAGDRVIDAILMDSRAHGTPASFCNDLFIRGPEVLFNPTLLGAAAQTTTSIQVAVYDAISKCQLEDRAALWSNIVLAGGTTQLRGFVGRLQSELTALAPSTCKVQVTLPEDAATSAWRGAKMAASSPGDAADWITREQWEEFGPSIFHR